MQTPPLTVSSLHSIEICSCHKMLQAEYTKQKAANVDRNCKFVEKLRIFYFYLFTFIYFFFVYLLLRLFGAFSTPHIAYTPRLLQRHAQTRTHTLAACKIRFVYSTIHTRFILFYILFLLFRLRVFLFRVVFFFISFYSTTFFLFFFFTGNFHAVCALQYKYLARSSIYKSCAAFLLDDVVVVGGRRLQAATATSKKSNKMPKKKAQQQQQVKYNKPKPNTNTKRDETSETKRNETKLSARRRQRRSRCLFL